MDLALVSQRIADAVKAVPDIVSSLPYVPEAVTVPCFYVGEVSETYDQTYGGGLVDAELVCRVLVDRTATEGSQAQLKRFMMRSGPTSVKAAIEGDRSQPQSLGGACADLHVRRLQGHRMYRVGENTYYGAEWIIRVIGTDSEEE